MIFAVFMFISVVYIKLADKFNIIDKPNHRSSHTISTIRGGGILFFIAMLIFFVTSNFSYPYFILGVSLIAIVSFIDDIVTLSSNVRLPFQFMAIALCLFQLGFGINNYLILLPLLIIGVGFINIYNFMDGINGITGFYSIVALIFFYLLNLKENIIEENLILYVLFSIIVFGFYNFRRKARMFSGDIGSISLAVLFFFLGAYFIIELQSPLLILTMLVYGTDAVLTLVYRKSIGEKITEPHRKHIYQKMAHILKISHLKIAFFYSLLQTFVNIIVYFYYDYPITIQISILFLVLIVALVLYYSAFEYIDRRKKLLE